MDTRHQQSIKEAKEALATMTEQIAELQDMEKIAMEEKENAIKWHICYTELQHDHSETLRESGENLERANNAEAQVESMAQALIEAAEKAQKDAQEIKDL